MLDSWKVNWPKVYAAMKCIPETADEIGARAGISREAGRFVLRTARFRGLVVETIRTDGGRLRSFYSRSALLSTDPTPKFQPKP
jgi:hypothetical protein